MESKRKFTLGRCIFWRLWRGSTWSSIAATKCFFERIDRIYVIK